MRSSAASAWIRTFRDDVLAEWRRAAHELPIANDMTSATLLDHVPELLDEIADIADELSVGAVAAPVLETARRHALDRLGDGFDVAMIVRELSLLRDAIFEVWMRSGGTQETADLRALDLALDRAIAASVARFAEVHDRTLAGIDRISTASFESSDVDDLMRRLLTVFIETTPAVDTAAILLVEGDTLQLRAAAGLEAELDPATSVALGEGFAGTIAARCEPLQLRAAHEDPLATNEVIRQRKVCALDGVPLVQGSRVIGVAYMGSLTAHELSAEDRQFFGSMAARASLGIAHHLLRHELAMSEQRFKQIAAEREQALAKLESLLAASPIGIAFVDRDLHYLLINNALAALNEQPASSHIGRSVADVLPGVAPLLEPLLRGVLETGRPALDIELMRPSQTDPADTRFLLASYFPVSAPSGEITGVGGIVLDTTEVRRAQEELRIAVRTREDVLAVVSHDLRSPLGTVQLSATVLMGQLAADPRARRHVELIHRSCVRMEHLIDDLLDTTAIRTGRLQLELRSDTVDSIIGETIDLQQPIAEEKGIRLVRSCEVEGAVLRCDRDRILQVLGNLIGNALKFCRTGDCVTVGYRAAGDHVIFSVSDTGPGIEPGVSPHLFEPYWSGANHVKQGAGLGLYICRGIVEGHGGRLWVESSPGAGATFHFTIPISRGS